MVFIPDTTGLDLREQERYWNFVREGREHEYHGIAVHPRHLSWFENKVLKRGKQYHPETDRKMKIEELRSLYEKVEGNKAREVEGGSGSGESVSDKVSTYFEWEKHEKGSP